MYNKQLHALYSAPTGENEIKAGKERSSVAGNCYNKFHTKKKKQQHSEKRKNVVKCLHGTTPESG